MTATASASTAGCPHRELPPASLDCPWCRLESARKEAEALRQAVEARDVLIGLLRRDLRLAQASLFKAEGGRVLAEVERDDARAELKRLVPQSTAERAELEELRMVTTVLRAALRVYTHDFKDVSCSAGCGADAIAGRVSYFCFEHAPNGAFIVDRKGGTA